MQRHETLTNNLCYDHQIVFHPVGLPVPLYIAASFILNVAGDKFADCRFDFEKTNEELGYLKKALFGTRFNACRQSSKSIFDCNFFFVK
uniref:SERPIN domain-containing protein n=1 Tax=Caenorhabditis tropicalis TaxID=1561998 RepID=A0A1I7TAY0_9PELO